MRRRSRRAIRCRTAALVGLAMLATACAESGPGTSSADPTASPAATSPSGASSDPGTAPAADPTSPTAPPPDGTDAGGAAPAGRFDLTATVDGFERTVVVDVPPGLDPTRPAPMVVYLHGSGGNGDASWTASGWKELGADEGVVTVFPTATVHCWRSADGAERTETVWNSYPGPYTLCPGENEVDDVAFLRTVIDRVGERVAIDADRVYLVGFSSGGRMAYRAAVELGDLLAAVVEFAGTNQVVDVGPDPVRPLPLAFEVGNEDRSWLGAGAGSPLDEFEYSLTAYPWFAQIIAAHLAAFDFAPTHRVLGDPDTAMSAVYPGNDDPAREFVFSVIAGLDHRYPNGVNHPVEGARRHWTWLQRFTR